MNFGTKDVNLSLASSLKLKPNKNDAEETRTLTEANDDEAVIDLADLLKEKGSIFKWIEEEPTPLQGKGDSHI